MNVRDFATAVDKALDEVVTTLEAIDDAIDDWNPSGGGSHTYSTTEQQVGVWTDNKPVYEIVADGGLFDADYVPTAAYNFTGSGAVNYVIANNDLELKSLVVGGSYVKFNTPLSSNATITINKTATSATSITACKYYLGTTAGAHDIAEINIGVVSGTTTDTVSLASYSSYSTIYFSFYFEVVSGDNLYYTINSFNVDSIDSTYDTVISSEKTVTGNKYINRYTKA